MSTWPKTQAALPVDRPRRPAAGPGWEAFAGVTVPNAQTFKVLGALEITKIALTALAIHPTEEGREERIEASKQARAVSFTEMRFHPTD